MSHNRFHLKLKLWFIGLFIKHKQSLDHEIDLENQGEYFSEIYFLGVSTIKFINTEVDASPTLFRFNKYGNLDTVVKYLNLYREYHMVLTRRRKRILKQNYFLCGDTYDSVMFIKLRKGYGLKYIDFKGGHTEQTRFKYPARNIVEAKYLCKLVRRKFG